MTTVYLMPLSLNESLMPTLPGAVLSQPSSGWRSIRVDSALVGHAYDLGADPDDISKLACFVCAQSTPWLDEDTPPETWSLTALRTANSERGRALKRIIPWWRINGTASTPFGARPITGAIITVPIPLPEQSPTVEAPWSVGAYSVTELIEPVLGVTVAGYAYPEDAEQT